MVYRKTILLLIKKVIKAIFFAPAQPTLIKFIYSKKDDKSAASGLYCKSFTMVIYDHNVSGLYYKTAIPANLALARIVNYNH